MTPSNGSQEDLTEQIEAPDQVFHSYLRAFYPFHPTYIVSDTAITLPLNPGDVVLVHSIHTNGWADGTLLESGARGWLPTNYCEAYGPDQMRTLLEALLNFWGLLYSRNTSNNEEFRNESMNRIVAGIRYLLEKSECLSRESSLIRNSESLRQCRKDLLSNLSLLFKTAERLRESTVGYVTYVTADNTSDIIDKMILRAFKIVNKGVQFLDVLAEDMRTRQRAANTQEGYNPPTGDLTIFETQRQASVHIKRKFSSHRLSALIPTAQRQKFVSERLDTSYDTFISCLGSFIGRLQVQSHSSAELLIAVRQSATVGLELLAIVEVVCTHDNQNTTSLELARTFMDGRIKKLVSATRNINVSSELKDEDVMMTQQNDPLIMSATDCVRAAEKCVAKTKLVIERIGDFEFEFQSGGLGINMALMDIVAEDETKTTPAEPGVTIPEPARAPPPPPLVIQSYKPRALNYQPSFSDLTAAYDADDGESKMLEKTYVHELLHNKEGQITGGTLPALVERLTKYDSIPDSIFASAFYLTFRLFVTPIELARTLVDRFDYIAESPHVAEYVRLRVYNVFKRWLESHWRDFPDSEAMSVIRLFASQKLSWVIPTAGRRLLDLTQKVSSTKGPLIPRLVSSAQYVPVDTLFPPSSMTKSQEAALKNWKMGGSNPTITDFDPLELARQFTIKEINIFCSIMPEELLGSEWTKRSGSNAMHVKAMSTLSTDLSNLVVDTILQCEDVTKRAAIVKHWINIAHKCLQLKNYHSLMAINCSLNSSTIVRLTRTWNIVSQEQKDTLNDLQATLKPNKNFAILRQRLQLHVPPCLPFLGIYLTDLIFVDAGNPAMKQLPGTGDHEGMPVINFDRYIKTAKVIGDLQRFQVPYRLIKIQDLQDWIQAEIVRVNLSSGHENDQYHLKSLRLEPRGNSNSKVPSPGVPWMGKLLIFPRTYSKGKRSTAGYPT